jgi:FMN phosphatase YigB (HAD superfamily)
LGGTPEAWRAANYQVIVRLVDADGGRARLRAAPDYASFERQYYVDWLRWMCELVGVPAPADDDCVVLGRAATRFITPRVCAAFPGAVAAIRTLRRLGYVLHTASGDGYLQGMGVRDCFDRLYGPDLVGAFKDGPRFYQRLFADAGLPPQDALVVDDNAEAVGWAAQAGAKTVLIGAATTSNTGSALCLASLAELPAWIERWA